MECTTGMRCDERRPTLLYNGYDAYVAQLYKG